MATTSPDNIWTQDIADNYDLVIDAAATAASVQAALVTRANSYTGTTAQRTAFTATAPEGTTWADTNGDKILWIKQGAVWVRVWPDVPAPDPPALGTFSFASGWDANSSVSLTRNGGRVHIDGIARPTGIITANAIIGTLPVNARPSTTDQMWYPAVGWVSGHPMPYLPRAAVLIASSGAVQVNPEVHLTAVVLDGISWPAKAW